MTFKDFVYKASWHWPFHGPVDRRLQKKIYVAAREVFSATGDRAPADIALPPEWGKGLSERVVELVLARSAYRPGMQVLDVGHANAQACHRYMVRDLPEPRHLTGIDIGKPIYDISGLYEDSRLASITETPFPDASFDLIWCISALEHFGMDNRAYAADSDVGPAPGMDSTAMREMVRILKPGGTLLVTVPFGRWEDHGWLRNYDAAHWQALLDVVKPQARVLELYFKHDDHGWSRAEPGELQDVSYFDQRNYGAAALAACLVTKE